MNEIRPAAVAGMFYPEDPQSLRQDVALMLAAARAEAVSSAHPPKALIVPHAGYVYSGPIAASGYARLQPWRDVIRRVVLFGPAHRVAVQGLALPDAAAFETPLGRIPVDADAVAQVQRLPQVVRSARAHALEHSLEVQLPFLQSVLGDFSVVPFAVGFAEAAEVAEVIELLWGGQETLILISSDLSHYHPYRDACAFDRATADAILALNPQLDHEQACGATPITGLVLCARHHGLVPELLDLRNSGDTAGDRARVVGYASLAFYEAGRDVH